MKPGAPQQLNRHESMRLVITAARRAGTIAVLCRIIGVTGGHLSRCRSGEDGMSVQTADKIKRFLAYTEKVYRSCTEGNCHSYAVGGTPYCLEHGAIDYMKNQTSK